MGDHVSIVREAKMPLGLLARVGLMRTCPEAGRWTGRGQDTLPDSQGSALCRAPGAPGPHASAGNASKRRNPDRQEPRQGQRWQVQQETTGAAGALGEDPPHRGVELGSHPHRVLPSPRRGASPGAALPRPSWDTPARLASPSGPAHRSAEPPAPAGGTPHLCSVSLALAGQGGRLAAEGASPAELSGPRSQERP